MVVSRDGGFCLSLLLQIKSTKPDKFTPRIVEKKDDYVHVEYESPILGVSRSRVFFPIVVSFNDHIIKRHFGL